ncbi:MAG TPA: TIGR02757 family protein [Nitrospiria bacterium]|nr:TIGR02757 family protein [Nitrospiria bacterium]
MSLSLPQERLRAALETLIKRPHFGQRVQDDPVEFPHRYTDQNDIEVVGLISALLAYGQVPLFKRVVERILEIMEGRPTKFCAETDPSLLRVRFEKIYYRMNSGRDIACLLYFIGEILRRHGSLRKLFYDGYRENEDDIAPALSRFVDRMIAFDPTPIYGKNQRPYGLRQLFSSPDRLSACKRFNLYLRWMIRPADGVDFGLWSEIPPSKLVIPLDTHIVRISRYLGLTRRRSPGWSMAKEITEGLKRFDPIDPLKYDFALCHLGISGACPIEKDRLKCGVCPLLASCRKGQGLLRGETAFVRRQAR